MTTFKRPTAWLTNVALLWLSCPFTVTTTAFICRSPVSFDRFQRSHRGTAEISQIRVGQAQQQPEEAVGALADGKCSLNDDFAGECLSSTGFVKGSSSFAIVTEVYVAAVESLRGRFPSFEEDGTEGSNMIKYNKRLGRRCDVLHSDSDSASNNTNLSSSHEANMEYNQIVSDQELVLVDIVRKPGMAGISRAFPRAGPRRLLHFDPTQVNAAIVTCGGLCPGLNNVIRELVHSLYYLYGANKVYGVRGGFHGFHKAEYEPVLLTNELVENIHHDGGTVLRSARGGFDIEKILSFLQERGINQLYVIGGDGTHRAAYAIHEACMARGLNIGISGIPKTIDNDLDYIDR